MNEREALHEESPYEITISNHVWDTGNVTRAYYTDQLRLLRNKFEALVLSTIVKNDTVYDKSISWKGIAQFLKPEVSQMWVIKALTFWHEFTGGKLRNWCRFMNESLVNSTVIAANIFLTCRGKISQRRHGIDRGGMENILRFSIREFFYIHLRGSEECNLHHSLGLREIYRLNVELENDAEENVISLKVPHPIDYELPHNFTIDVFNAVESYCGLIHDSLRENVWGNINDRGGGGITFVQNTVPKLKFKREWIERGLSIWNYLAGPRREGFIEPWCKLMNDELIFQLYMTGNSVFFVRTLMESLNMFNISEIYFNDILKYYMKGTCHNFFCIDCKDYVCLRGPNEWELRSDNQWSGHWGIKMLFEQNFKKIEGEFYNNLFGYYYTQEGTDQNRYFMEHNTRIHRSHIGAPYPSAPNDLIREHFLTFLMGTDKKYLHKDFENMGGNPLQTKLDDIALHKIFEQMSVKS